MVNVLIILGVFCMITLLVLDVESEDRHNRHSTRKINQPEVPRKVK